MEQSQNEAGAMAASAEPRPGRWIYGGKDPDTRDNQIARILGEFDFHRVQSAMHALDWRWTHAGGVPGIRMLVETATHLLRDVSVGGMISTGGFEARCCQDGSLTLTFVLCDCDGDEWVPC